MTRRSAQEKDTVSAYFVRAATARLAPEMRARALQIAHISPEIFGADQARVAAPAFAALWMAVAHELDDEFFGLDHRRMKVGSFAMLSHAVLHSETVGQAIRGILRGFRVLLDDVTATLQVHAGEAAIVIDNRIEDAASRRFADETFLVMVHGLMSWLAGQRVAITCAEFTGPRPPYAQEYAVMFSEHLKFDVASTAIRFDAGLLDARVVQTAASIKVFLREAPQSVFLKYRNTSSWAARVRRHLRRDLEHANWPVLEDISSALGVAPTTLRRRLEAEGTSYQEIKDGVRRDTAIHHLSQTSQSVTDIAALVGFQDASSFRRAFRQWTGVQPSQYRQGSDA